MDGIRHEVARSGDASLAPRLAELDRAAFPPRLQYGEEGFRVRLRRAGAWLALAWAGDLLVGFCLAAPDEEDPRALFLDVLATHPAWRRRGIAAGLAALCADHARATGRGAVTLTCEPLAEDGTDLVEVYKRLGFEVVGSTPEWHAMRLTLEPSSGRSRSPGSPR